MAITQATGGTFAYTAAGSGPPLVLLHAFPLDRGMWEGQWQAFADRCRVIAVDLPGFGQSPVDPAYTVDTAADRLAILCNQLNLPKVVVGGLSMGGYVALAFARRHPRLLAGLILADTRSEPDDAPGKENRNRLVKLTEEYGPSKVYEVMLPKVLAERTQKEKPEVMEFARMLAARQTAAGVVRGLMALRDRPDATPDLAEIAVPTLVIVGEEDSVTPPSVAEAMANRIRGSKLVRIPVAGHLANLDQPAAFNAAISEFLDRIYPRTA
jgi:pimeloyl-ACP methyl ester carboxylesterase